MIKETLLLTVLLAINVHLFAHRNVIVIVADDQGYSHMNCYGNSFYETPNIDFIADNGVRFTQGYAATPVCSPTRISFLTGKYPARTNATDWLNGYAATSDQILEMPAWKMYLDEREITIADKLQDNGYTTGFYGKWHVGSDPHNHGFERAFEYYNPSSSLFDADQLENGNFKDEHWNDVHNSIQIADSTIAFLEDNVDNPMFLYVAYNAVHTPMVERVSRVDKYKEKAEVSQNENNPILAAMTETLDESVGMIYNKVEELGLLDSTIFIYFSDNGCRLADAPMPPLAGGKSELYEGGVRVPFIVNWKNSISGGQVSNTHVVSTDIYTTILDLVDIDYRELDYPDSKSFTSSLFDGVEVVDHPIFFHYPHYHPENLYGPQGAIVKGDYKLIINYEEYFSGVGNPYALYNLTDDIGEKNNLYASMPEKVNELDNMFTDWKEQVDAQDPRLKGSLGIEEGTYYIQAVHSDQCIAIKDASLSQSANVQQETFDQTKTSQQWVLHDQGNAFFTIENKNSGYLMSVDAWLQTPGANVSVWGTEAGQSNQTCRQWQLVEIADGEYQIIGRHAGMSLEIADSAVIEGANVQINDINSKTKNMTFKLIAVPEEEVLFEDGGSYYIEAVSSAQVMAVSGASIESAANVAQEEKRDLSSQRWIFHDQGNGYYTIENENSNYLACVAGWGTTPGSNVVVWGTEADHAHQTCRQWKFTDIGDGTYTIYANHAQLYIGVNNEGNIEVNSLDPSSTNMQFKIYSLATNTIEQERVSLSITAIAGGDEIVVKSETFLKGNYTIVDMCGRTILSNILSDETVCRINSSQLKEGMYIICINVNNQIYTKEFIK